MIKRALLGCGTLLLTFFTLLSMSQVASAAVAPVITQVTPLSIPGGEPAVITGSGFDSHSVVLFGNYEVVPSASSPTVLSFNTVLGMTCGGDYYVQVKQKDTGVVSNQFLVHFVKPLPVDPPEINVTNRPWHKLPPGFRMVIDGPGNTFGCGQGVRPNFGPGLKIVFDGNTAAAITPTIDDLTLEVVLPTSLALGNHYMQALYNGHLSNKINFDIAEPYALKTPILRTLKIYSNGVISDVTYNSDNIQTDYIEVVADNLQRGTTVLTDVQVWLDGKKLDTAQFAGGDPQPFIFNIPKTITAGTHQVSVYNPNDTNPSLPGAESNKLQLIVRNDADRPAMISGVGANFANWTFVPIDKEGATIRVTGRIYPDSVAIIDGVKQPSEFWSQYYVLNVPIPASLNVGTHKIRLGSKNDNRALSNEMTFEAKKLADMTPDDSNLPKITTVDPIRALQGQAIVIHGENLSCSSFVMFSNMRVTSSGCATTAAGVKFAVPATTPNGSHSIEMSDPSTGKKTDAVWITVGQTSGPGSTNQTGDSKRTDTVRLGQVPFPVLTTGTSGAGAQQSISDYIAKLRADMQQRAAASRQNAASSAVSAPRTINPPMADKKLEACVGIERSLGLRSKDAKNSSDVTMLQSFLVAGDYLKAEPTGYYGALTAKAVKSFQKANGISQTGTVGPQTRAKIKSFLCN
ncbi:MAG TPA: peptidoglycan-binding protein [Candidatus Paceibacterota bacterium]|nr:peptidoglycan-binding protein [Candidatus Paceibacterota bacterium]